MSTRPLVLAILTVAASSLTACADITSPTRSAPLAPGARASHDVVCKTGGWNSSTGRCE